eukprot:10430851-Alexandrium_andersonii.AAC.1
MAGHRSRVSGLRSSGLRSVLLSSELFAPERVLRPPGDLRQQELRLASRRLRAPVVSLPSSELCCFTRNAGLA